MKSDEKSSKNLDGLKYQGDDLSTESFSSEYSIGNPLDHEDTNFLPVASTAAAEDNPGMNFPLSEDEHRSDFLDMNDHLTTFAESQPVTDEPGNTERFKETFSRRRLIR